MHQAESSKEAEISQFSLLLVVSLRHRYARLDLLPARSRCSRDCVIKDEDAIVARYLQAVGLWPGFGMRIGVGCFIFQIVHHNGVIFALFVSPRAKHHDAPIVGKVGVIFKRAAPCHGRETFRALIVPSLCSLPAPHAARALFFSLVV